MIEKLQGEAYINHWVARISKGPYEAGDEQNGEDTWRYVREHLADFDPLSVLEFGCASGWLSLEMARHGARVEGIDIAESAIAVARELVGFLWAALTPHPQTTVKA